MWGKFSEVGGIISETSNMNTDSASSTVMPSDTFSPESGGNMNASKDMVDSRTQGKTKLTT